MRSGHVIGRGLAFVLAAIGVAACAAMETRTEPSLYQRLGGRDAIASVVDEFVGNVVKDDRINARFKALQPAQVAKLKTNLSDQICAGSGGPCAYLGKDMKTTHEGMKITETEWSATVEALVRALDKFKVPAKEKSELLAVLGPMKKDIVGQ